MLKIDAKASELFLYDVIGQDYYGGGITGSAVTDALKELSGKRVRVRINSPGGTVDEGIAIYNALRRHNGGVDTVNDALAASIASIIFLAGETRTMAEGSRLMIHRALTIEVGNATQMRKTADVLEVHDKSLVEIYSRFITNKSEDEIMQLLDAETWFTRQEAVDIGLANATTSATAQKAKMAAWFRNPPSGFFEAKQLASVDAQLQKAKQRKLTFQLI